MIKYMFNWFGFSNTISYNILGIRIDDKWIICNDQIYVLSILTLFVAAFVSFSFPSFFSFPSMLFFRSFPSMLLFRSFVSSLGFGPDAILNINMMQETSSSQNVNSHPFVWQKRIISFGYLFFPVCQSPICQLPTYYLVNENLHSFSKMRIISSRSIVPLQSTSYSLKAHFSFSSAAKKCFFLLQSSMFLNIKS